MVGQESSAKTRRYVAVIELDVAANLDIAVTVLAVALKRSASPDVRAAKIRRVSELVEEQAEEFADLCE